MGPAVRREPRQTASAAAPRPPAASTPCRRCEATTDARCRAKRARAARSAAPRSAACAAAGPIPRPGPARPAPRPGRPRPRFFPPARPPDGHPSAALFF